MSITGSPFRPEADPSSPDSSNPSDDVAAIEQDWNRRHLDADAPRPAFRVWRYARPAIVLGVSQRSRLMHTRARAGDRLDVLVRDSGGGAVLTWPGFVSLSVALPHGHPGAASRVHESYRWLGEIHLQALAMVGVGARLVAPEQLRATATERRASDVGWACFGSLAPWEVVSGDGRKLSGFAQKRGRHGVLLVAGTLVTPPDWTLLAEALGESPRDAAALARQTVCAGEIADRPIDPAAFAEQLARRVQDALGVPDRPARDS
jgi:lipoate-protein ligase A